MAFVDTTAAWIAIVGVAAGLALSSSVNRASAQERSPSVCEREAAADRFKSVSPLGDIALESGSSVSLSGIRLPDEGPFRERALQWLRQQEGKPVAVRRALQPDRWNRFAANLALADPSNPLDLARGLVESGLALVDAGMAETHCQPDLLILEAASRKQSLGVWAEDRYKPIDATQRDRLRERVGAFVLVEGRVRSIGERKQRTYLNFGGKWAEDFTIIISKRTWDRMAGRGLTTSSLKNSRIRARGILEEWQGTALTIKAPEMIERFEDLRPR